MPSTASSILTEVEKEACIILSDLFLDTEQTKSRLKITARALKRLQMPLGDLEKIIRYDLFPILFWNLLSGMGEWGMFDGEWLIQEVERQRIASPGHLKSAAHYAAWLAMGHLVNSDWEQIKARLQTNSRSGIGSSHLLSAFTYLFQQIEIRVHRLMQPHRLD